MSQFRKYRVSLGWGPPTTQPLRPQPKSSLGVIPARVRLAADLNSVPDGQMTAQLEWNDAITYETFDSLLAQLGLMDEQSTEIVITLPNDKNREFLYYQGIVHQPREKRYELGSYKNIVFAITDLVELSGDFNADFSEDFAI